MKKFLNWLKGSASEPDGQASSRRLTMWWSMVLITGIVAVYLWKVDSPEWLFNLAIAFLLFILLLAGVVTIEKVITLVQSIKFGKKDGND